MKTSILLLILILSLAVVGLTRAEDGPGLPRQVLGGGGTVASAGETSLRATLGQPAMGLVSAGQVALGQGFWHGGAAGTGWRIYLPLMLRDS